MAELRVVECIDSTESGGPDSVYVDLSLVATNAGQMRTIRVHLYQEGFDSLKPNGPPMILEVYEQEVGGHGTKMLFSKSWRNQLGTGGS